MFLGVGRQRVHDLYRAGLIEALPSVGGRLVFSRRSVEIYRTFRDRHMKERGGGRYANDMRPPRYR